MKKNRSNPNIIRKSVDRFLESIQKPGASLGPNALKRTPDKPLATNTEQHQQMENEMSLNISELTEISGFIGACVVDSDTGLMLASEGGGKLDLEAAGAANTQVVKAKLQAIETLALDDAIEDILITLGKQFHLIRPLEKNPSIFIYVALEKKAANLGLARIQAKKVEKTLSI